MVVSYLLSVGKTRPKSNRPYVGYLNRGRLFSYLGILVRFAPKYRLGSLINIFLKLAIILFKRQSRLNRTSL